MERFDAFICHASEDKGVFVRPLADSLTAAHLHVWYDEFSLRPGDSLRRAIDLGLRSCRYGIVVLSPSFFNKSWTQWELDGLVQRQLSTGESLIIPIWHKVGRKEVADYSLSLADKVAISSDRDISHVTTEILRVIRPQGSTLLLAQEMLEQHSFATPPVTDDWWLDIVEYSGSEELHNRWTFPLPGGGDAPAERAQRIAWAAMQRYWTIDAEDDRISQVDPPDRIIEFVRSRPGLLEICHAHPEYLATYAPQVTLAGFGADFDGLFDSWARVLLDRRSGLPSAADARRYPAPAWDSALNFRLRDRVDESPAEFACQWVQGELMGLPVKLFETFEYLAWLLSDRSQWLPPDLRGLLLEGMKEWTVWPWMPKDRKPAFFHQLYTAAEEERPFTWSDTVEQDLVFALTAARRILALPETVPELVARFIASGCIESYIREHHERKSRHASKPGI